MDRRVALVLVWALSAAVAIGVGFAAAGLVGDPLLTTERGVPGGWGAPMPSAPEQTTPTGSDTPTGPTSQTPGTGSASPTPDRTSPTTGPTRSPAPRPAITRTLSTRAGLVAATCRGGLVRLAASPAVGWQIEDIDEGPRREARVRFERGGDSDARVEVESRCVNGRPQFTFDDRGDDRGDDDRTEEPDDSRESDTDAGADELDDSGMDPES